MATKAKKAVSKTGKALESKTGAGAAVAERSKDAKPTFGKASPKTVKQAAPAKAAAPAAKPAASAKTASKPTAKAAPKKASEGPSMAKRVVRKVKEAASGAVAMAASVIGKDDKKPKTAKSK
jgi:hypothetical protein